MGAEFDAAMRADRVSLKLPIIAGVNVTTMSEDEIITEGDELTIILKTRSPLAHEIKGYLVSGAPIAVEFVPIPVLNHLERRG
jgi:hypothetical protein